MVMCMIQSSQATNLNVVPRPNGYLLMEERFWIANQLIVAMKSRS